MASHAIAGCLSPSPIPLLLSEVSPLFLPVTLAHFAQSFYERALPLPTSFFILGLARLEVKPRLSRLTWRVFASTHPIMLSPTSPRKVLLACSPFFFETSRPSLGSPPFLPRAHALTLLFLVKVWLSLTLTLSVLTIWCF